MKKIYNKIIYKKIYILLLLLILTVINSFNLFRDGLPMGHDYVFHIYRIKGLSDNIKLGIINPVYFNCLEGFGYANGLFYPDIFLYIPAILNVLGINLITSFKIFIFLINFLSIASMYICVKNITKKKYTSIIGAILYALCIYRFTDTYIRFAIGECLTFIFIPIFILGIYELFYNENKKSYYLTIGLIGVLFSHVITFYLTCILFIVFIIINIKKLKDKKILKNLLINIFISILITSSFWLPFLEQIISQSFSFKEYSPVNENIVPIIGLFMDFPIHGIFTNWLPPGIGFCYYIILYYIIKYKNNLLKKDKFFKIIVILGIISLIFVTFSLLWKIPIIYKILSIIQFPWRFYMFAQIFMIISTCILFKYNKNVKLINIVIIYSAIIFMMNMIIVNNKMHIEAIRTVQQIGFGEYLPKESDEDMIYNYKNENIDYKRVDQYTIINIKNNDKEVEAPLIYYKGYKACDSKKCYKTYKTANGLLGIELDSNTKELKISYEGTFIYKISKYISLLGIIIYVAYLIKVKKQKEV